jgi:hypothetical protein
MGEKDGGFWGVMIEVLQHFAAGHNTVSYRRFILSR